MDLEFLCIGHEDFYIYMSHSVFIIVEYFYCLVQMLCILHMNEYEHGFIIVPML